MVLRLGVTGLKKARVAYLLDLFEGGERMSSVINCVWSDFRSSG